jgi:hypothetical protein
MPAPGVDLQGSQGSARPFTAGHCTATVQDLCGAEGGKIEAAVVLPSPTLLVCQVLMCWG